MKIFEKGSKKLTNAWAFYDWANSVYPLVISTAVFPIYYSSITSSFANEAGNEAPHPATVDPKARFLNRP